MILKNIVPWGRLKEEYVQMFNLTKEELESTILGCGDGPSSFNSESSSNVVSIDPIYKYSKEEIKQRIDETADIICNQLEESREDFIWTQFKDIDDLRSTRLKAMSLFLDDYDGGKQEKRYIECALPVLNFEDDSFDLVLSSHFLFLYSVMLDYEFHKNSIKEMLRVGKHIKIFPLCDLQGKRSKHLDDILNWLTTDKISHRLCKTTYEFQKGADSYLEIYK